VTTKRAGFWRRHRALKWAAGVLLLALIALGIAISIALHQAEPMMRAAIVNRLEEHFHARVELDSFHMSLVDGLWAEGKGLRIWPPAQVQGVRVPGTNTASEPDPPARPIIQIAEFRFHAPLRYKLGEPLKISVVELKGLDVDVPPRTHFTHKPLTEMHTSALLRFKVESIDCEGARLTLETDKPGKLPLEFDIAHIKLSSIIAGGTMQFDAKLTNPKPQGTIETKGSMGPWMVDDPGETPLKGGYQFEHADLGTFKGIAGILQSTGQYQGVLRDLTVDGVTDTPDFRLTKFGTAVPLHTVFHAHVDGTNGDTWLEPVNATLGQTHFTAAGKVVRVPQGTASSGTVTPGGHMIALNVTVNGGRMEDFLRLTSKNGKPLLTGTLALKTTLVIPPGTAPVDEKLKLSGSFRLEDAEFTDAKIQNEVGELSLRGQGHPREARSGEGAEVRTSMRSDFTMGEAVIAFSRLKYTVPGAEIDLNGTYDVQQGLLDFTGTAKLQATVSEMVGGWKGALLKPADRYFRRDGAGTEVPIHVNGTREEPRFGIDLGRMKHASPQIPGSEFPGQPQ